MALLVIYPLPLQTKLNQGDDKNEGKQYPGHGRGRAHPPIAEGVLNNLLNQYGSRLLIALLGHDPHLIKNLERRNERNNQRKKGGG